MAHRLIVSGARACFQRPEFGVDLITYDIITPMAARGVFESVHWTPAIRWVIERIDVLRPIRTEWLSPGQDGAQGRAGCSGQRGRALQLVDVSYVVQARFELTAAAGAADHAAQHAGMFRRRARARRYFRQPYLGRRDLVASAQLIAADERPVSAYVGAGTIDLGWMIYDRDPADRAATRYFRPIMHDGIVDVSAIDARMLPG